MNEFLLYNQDNLELMRSMEDNSVDLIYSDILYGTGRDFGPYQDIKKNFEEIQNFYRPRFLEFKRILKDTGNIIIQMDYHINYMIRFLLDEIFGMNNFRNEIIWHYNSAPHKKGCLGHRHDTLLRYTKSNVFTFNEVVREPYSPTAPRGYEKEKYYHPEGKLVGDVWQIKMIGQNDKTERTGYPTQKPLELMNRIVKLFSNEGDMVFDAFMGSGSIGMAALQNNRKFIGCDISEEAYNITKERLESML